MTRTENVLAVLETYDWVCGDDLVEVGGRRFSARIHDLRQSGYDIRRRVCEDSRHHHLATVFEYHLVATVGQLVLGGNL